MKSGFLSQWMEATKATRAAKAIRDMGLDPTQAERIDIDDADRGRGELMLRIGLALMILLALAIHSHGS